MPGYQGDPGETIMGALHMPSYELEDSSMVIHDVVWGDCSIGDRQPYDSLLMERRGHHYSAGCKRSSN